MLDAGGTSGSPLAAIIGVVTLLIGASGVFGELQASMNEVWDVEPKPTGIFDMIRGRFLSFGMVLGTGFLLVVSLLLSTLIAGLRSSAETSWPQFEPIMQSLTFFVTFAIVTLLFALIFKFLPDAPVAWHHVWFGAILTAILFSIGKLAIGLYLGKSGLASSYGAAGSLVVVVVWIYYSAQILLFGAEITHTLARREARQNQGEKGPSPTTSPPARGGSPESE
jgi:membrane protein